MQFAIHLELAPLVNALGDVINDQVLPRVADVIWRVGQKAQTDWMEAVQRANLWQGERDAYASSIELQSTGAYSALVSTDYKYAVDIETGRPPYDLKRMLQTSTKVRVSKAGKKYLIIPFQHNVKSMPQGVHQAAKALAPSRVTGKYLDPRVSPNPGPGGSLVRPIRSTYAWGGRLKVDAAPGMLKKHVGMVRFDQSTPKAPRSGYFTFRVMSESSAGWILPAKAGQHIAENVVNGLRPWAEQQMALAFANAA